MTIRYATMADVQRIAELAEREHRSSAFRALAFDMAAARETVRQFINGIGRTVLCTDGGYIAGHIQPSGFSRAPIAYEFAWFAEDGQGMELLKRFEGWASRMGAAAVIVHNHHNLNGLDRILTRRRRYSRVGQAMLLPLE